VPSMIQRSSTALVTVLRGGDLSGRSLDGEGVDG
jgi:hypothetical protein